MRIYVYRTVIKIRMTVETIFMIDFMNDFQSIQYAIFNMKLVV